MATVRRPNSLAARRMRMAISLRFRARSFFMDGARKMICFFEDNRGGGRRAGGAKEEARREDKTRESELCSDGQGRALSHWMPAWGDHWVAPQRAIWVGFWTSCS